MREVPRPRGLVIEQTLLDRAIAWFDPIRGARRLHARATLALAGGGAYHGASRSRRAVAGWNAPPESADAALMPDLPVLRDRSRDLVRNVPLAAGALNTVVTRVIGTGLSLMPAVDRAVLGLSADEATAWQAQVRRRWAMWAESAWCDCARRQTFYGLQALALRSALEAGDAFALLPIMPAQPDRPHQLAVKLIEGDRVANPHGEQDRPSVTGGIRMDADGAPLACHVLRQHPGSNYGVTLQGDWIDWVGAASGRRNVLHVCEPRRIGQTRGEPYLAPVVEALKQLGRYTDAEIQAAVISSFFTVFVKHDTGEGLDPMLSAASGNAQTSDARSGDAWDGKLSSGLAVDLPKGATVEFADPSRPNTAFDPFVQAVLRQIGTCLEIPFEILIKHFTSSFTAARAALLDFWLVVRRRREWMAATFCQPVYEEWLRIEVATGRTAAPGFFSEPLIRAAWSNAHWIGDAMGVLDPQREIKAVTDALDAGLTTLADEIMKLSGLSWEDVHAQQVRERQARKRDGLHQSPPAVAAPSTPPAPGRPDNHDEDDDDDTES
jgi:lambda family phage portal protein